MRIEHLALWASDLERLKNFYVSYFEAVAGERYHNPKKQFHSYFLSFSGGSRLEIMTRTDIIVSYPKPSLGLAHFAISVGSKERVDALTERLRNDGYTIKGEPRTTGDGYYESVVLDPDGNEVEITV